MAPRRSRSTEAFFGRRRGKTIRPLQADGACRRACGATGSISARRRRRISATLFPLPVADVRLEIGFGGGEHLLHEAPSHPDTGFIGVEPFVNGMAKLMTALAEKPLANLRVYDDDATQLLDWLPDASLGGHRSALSRPVAEEEALEAPLRQPGQSRPLCPRAEAGRRFPLRLRHRHLRQLDAARTAARMAASTGRRRMRTTGARPIRAGRERATRRRRCARAGVPPI